MGSEEMKVIAYRTERDPLVVVANESAYAELIAAAGREDRLFQTYTTGNGHCAFTGTQLLTAVGAMMFGCELD
jgi:hypothetical protein